MSIFAGPVARNGKPTRGRPQARKSNGIRPAQRSEARDGISLGHGHLPVDQAIAAIGIPTWIKVTGESFR